MSQGPEVYMSQTMCLTEIYTAIEAGIPIVTLDCHNKGYDHVQAKQFLFKLDNK